MTVEEALKEIVENGIELGAGDYVDVNALKVARKALEKQIAKKPIIKEWSPAKCPCCGCDLSESIGDGYYKHFYSLMFCECGQKLDWSEV